MGFNKDSLRGAQSAQFKQTGKAMADTLYAMRDINNVLNLEDRLGGREVVGAEIRNFSQCTQ